MKLKATTLSILLSIACFPAISLAQLRPGAFATVRTADTTANSLIVGGAPGATSGTGGIKAGPIVASSVTSSGAVSGSQVTVNGVGIIGTDGRIPAISSTYFASLSGANLTGLVETQIADGTLLARVADSETISGAWTFTNAAGPIITNTAPILKWIETGGTANEGRWRMIADGDLHVFQACNDAESSCSNVWVVDRAGATLGQMTLGATQILGVNGTVAAPTYAFSADGTGTATDSGIYFQTGVTPAVAVSVNGTQAAFFGAGSATITGSTAITGAAAVVGLSVQGTSATPLNLNRTVSDGTMADFQRDGVSQGSVSVSGATVAYNTFMGAHYTQLRPGQEIPESGMVVVADGVIPAVRRLGVEPQDDAERFVYVKPSTRRNQKAVYGLWFADLGQTAEHMSWGDPNEEVYQVAGLGLTTGWVTDTCGNISAGDFLASSPVEGLAERQCTVGAGGKPGYDPVNRDYTLGKSLVDVDFSKVAPDADSVRRVRIPLTLKAS